MKIGTETHHQVRSSLLQIIVPRQIRETSIGKINGHPTLRLPAPQNAGQDMGHHPMRRPTQVLRVRQGHNRSRLQHSHSEYRKRSTHNGQGALLDQGLGPIQGAKPVLGQTSE